MKLLRKSSVAKHWTDEVTVSLELIDPSTAKAYLATNSDNYRNLIPSHRNRLVADMKAGRWTFTNASIGFDVNGVMVDGQHRLEAIVESGCPCWSLVVRGMPDGTKDNPSVDTGSRRSVSTHLSKHGVANPNIVAAVARALWRLRSGISSRSGGCAATDVQIAEIVASDATIEEATAATSKCKKLASPTMIATWFWLARFENEDLAIECSEILAGQREASSFHPFVKLREVFVQHNGSVAKNRMRDEVVLKYLMSAWAKALKGETVKLLRPAKMIVISDAADATLQRIR